MIPVPVSTGLPTLKDEIERKSFETIEWLFNAVDKSLITNFQFETGINTLFMSISGLVDASIFDLVTAANETIGPEKQSIGRHFVKGGLVVSLVWKVGSDCVTVTVRHNGKVERDSVRNFDTAVDARFWLGMYGDQLRGKGFEEL